MKCCLCRFTFGLDDVRLSLVNGECVCLRCYGRETDTALRVPKSLRLEVSALLHALTDAAWMSK